MYVYKNLVNFVFVLLGNLNNSIMCNGQIKYSVTISDCTEMQVLASKKKRKKSGISGSLVYISHFGILFELHFPKAQLNKGDKPYCGGDLSRWSHHSFLKVPFL